jgi:DNA-binding NarL/FixJ family response regulator
MDGRYGALQSTMMTGESQPPDPDKGSQEGPNLTDRQYEVLCLIAEGEAQAAIAAKLRVSTNTIRDHIRLILAKLRAKDRPHAVCIAFRLGILR